MASSRASERRLEGQWRLSRGPGGKLETELNAPRVTPTVRCGAPRRASAVDSLLLMIKNTESGLGQEKWAGACGEKDAVLWPSLANGRHVAVRRLTGDPLSESDEYVVRSSRHAEATIQLPHR